MGLGRLRVPRVELQGLVQAREHEGWIEAFLHVREALDDARQLPPHDVPIDGFRP
jgi:hypothetical protein